MPRTIMGEEFLSVPEAAKEIGLSRCTLAKWLKTGADKKGGNVRLLIENRKRILIAKESVPFLRRRRYEEGSF